MPRFPKRQDRKPRYGGAPRWKKPRAGKKRGVVGNPTEGIRLQKVLAAAGVGSRRQCEEMIREGRIDVDGKTVTELGTRVDAGRQQIRVDGEALRRPKRVYMLINKPVGILATNRDPSGRPRVIDLAPSNERLFTAGRLDKSSEGLILVTNDGELTDLLTHPRYGVEKSYLALVVGVPSTEALNQLRKGVHFAEGFAHAKQVRVRRTHKQSSVLEIVLDEGRNREVRRLLARIGHKVLRLQRVAMGPLRLGNLKPGESRSLSREEVDELYHAAKQGRKKKQGAGRPVFEKVKSVAGTVTPIIDYSLPVDSLPTDSLPTGDECRPLSDDELATLMSEESTSNANIDDVAEDDFDGLDEDRAEPGETFGNVSDEEATGKVDLTPIKLGPSRRPPERTVIGADKRRQGGARGADRGAGRRQQKTGRHQKPQGRQAQGRQRKPDGRTEGRNGKGGGRSGGRGRMR